MVEKNLLWLIFFAIKGPDVTANGTLPLVCRQLIYKGLVLEDSIAVFLIIKGDFSYYSASTGWFDADWVWHKEYDAVYGEPTAPAKTSEDGMVYTRSYTHCDVVSNCTGVGRGNCKGTITFK